MSLSDPALPMKVIPVTVTAQTVAKLREAIVSGVFKPGQRLLEQNLCDRMGVSRTSVREALRRLEAERLITMTPNRGPSVTQIAWSDAQAIYEVRALLEGEAAALFASRVTKGELAEMKLALADFERAVSIESPLERLSATERFYSVILRGCANPVIGEIIQGLVARINFLRARSMSLEGRARHSAVEMWRMYDAIEKRKPDAARKAAVEHVTAACAAAREAFQSEEDSSVISSESAAYHAHRPRAPKRAR
jgi:GntR family transcriptional regulator, trigonelline degradation regulator